VHPELPDIMFELAGRAFEEDRRMIEAQQRNLKLRPEPQPLMIGHDRGPSLFRSVVEKLVRQEQEAAATAAKEPAPLRAVERAS
jgi:phenylpropionate dioxygenase-like ring-hydroxylating dioxygenase large terminal subunit